MTHFGSNYTEKKARTHAKRLHTHTHTPTHTLEDRQSRRKFDHHLPLMHQCTHTYTQEISFTLDFR